MVDARKKCDCAARCPCAAAVCPGIVVINCDGDVVDCDSARGDGIHGPGKPGGSRGGCGRETACEREAACGGKGSVDDAEDVRAAGGVECFVSSAQCRIQRANRAGPISKLRVNGRVEIRRQEDRVQQFKKLRFIPLVDLRVGVKIRHRGERFSAAKCGVGHVVDAAACRSRRGVATRENRVVIVNKQFHTRVCDSKINTKIIECAVADVGFVVAQNHRHREGAAPLVDVHDGAESGFVVARCVDLHPCVKVAPIIDAGIRLLAPALAEVAGDIRCASSVGLHGEVRRAEADFFVNIPAAIGGEVVVRVAVVTDGLHVDVHAVAVFRRVRRVVRAVEADLHGDRAFVREVGLLHELCTDILQVWEGDI